MANGNGRMSGLLADLVVEGRRTWAWEREKPVAVAEPVFVVAAVETGAVVVGEDSDLAAANQPARNCASFLARGNN